MLKILGGLFAARQRGVEDGAAAHTFYDLYTILHSLDGSVRLAPVDFPLSTV